MKIKSYFARTVEGAMATARQELGPDAMLVNSRKTSLETRHLGEYEVVFATVGAGAEAATAAPPVDSTSFPALPLSAQPFGERLATEGSRTWKKELKGCGEPSPRSGVCAGAVGGVAPDVSDAYAMLTASEVAPDIARDIVNRPGPGWLCRAVASRPQVQCGCRGISTACWKNCNRVSKRPRWARGRASRGSWLWWVLRLRQDYAGQARSELWPAARRPVLLLSMDTQRVGAAEQLRSYAAILESPSGAGDHQRLAQAIEENRAKS
jgi:hypothetical protein